MHNPQATAKRIERLTKERGCSINKMLQDCGINPTAVYNMKRGRVAASDTVVKIADYLGTTTDYLLKGEENNLKKKGNEKMTDNEKLAFSRLLTVYEVNTPFWGDDEYVLQKGIGVNELENWEEGFYETEPPEDVMEQIFSYIRKKYPGSPANLEEYIKMGEVTFLSVSEKKLINDYRELDEDGKSIIKAEIEKEKRAKELKANENSLSS